MSVHATGDLARPTLPSAAPSVSVIVPCHNYGRYLRDCVESVLNQAGVDLRVLIVDDGSTDDSACIAAALAAADPRVALRVHAANQGHIRTYNEGLRWAAATYTVLVDADDLLTPGSLQRACALLDAHPEVGFAYGPVLVFGDDGCRPPPAAGPGDWTIWRGREWFELRCRAAENCIYSPEVVVRTSLLRQVGGYRDELPHSADLELWMRLALHADVGRIAGPHQAYYRDHATGMHRRQFGTVLADLTQVGAAFELLFRDHGGSMVDRHRLEELVRCRLAQRALEAACRAYDLDQWNANETVGLEALAVSTFAGAHQLAEMRGLRWRKRLGPGVWRSLHCLLSNASRLPRALRRRLRPARVSSAD